MQQNTGYIICIPDDAKVFELQKHLHEQYAINNNSKLTSIISLLTIFLAVIGAYGYVFVHTSLEWAANFGDFISHTKACTTIYKIDVLLLATMASYFVIFISYYLCAYLGTDQRKEQFIIDAIRRTNGVYIESIYSIFPKNYHPYRKSKKNFIIGLFGEFMPFLRLLAYGITLFTGLKIFFASLAIFRCTCSCVCSCCHGINFGILHRMIVVAISFIILRICFRTIVNSQYRKYSRVHNEFRGKSYIKDVTTNQPIYGKIIFPYDDAQDEDLSSDLHQKKCCLRDWWQKGREDYLNIKR